MIQFLLESTSPSHDSGEEEKGKYKVWWWCLIFVLPETKIGAELHIPLGRYQKNMCHLQDCRHVCAVGWDPKKIGRMLIQGSFLVPALQRRRGQTQAAADCGHREIWTTIGSVFRSPWEGGRLPLGGKLPARVGSSTRSRPCSAEYTKSWSRTTPSTSTPLGLRDTYTTRLPCPRTLRWIDSLPVLGGAGIHIQMLAIKIHIMVRNWPFAWKMWPLTLNITNVVKKMSPFTLKMSLMKTVTIK